MRKFTDVTGKGDIFSLILKQEEVYQKKNLPEHFSDYPEQVYETLVLFYKIWELQPLAVPNRRQKSKFSQWVVELEKMTDICGTLERTKIGLTDAYKFYTTLNKPRPIVYAPSIVFDWLIHALTEHDREENKPVEKTVDKKRINNIISRFED